MLQKDVKQVIISLISELDFYFEENEFIRRSNSLTYIRKLDGVTQKVEIVFFSNPSYHPGALAHIYPHMQIYIPSVNATTKEYASHLIPSKWLDQFTIRQPIQIYSHSGDFWLVDVNEYESLKDQLLDFFEKNAISLFNDLMSDKDYLLLYENKDKRIIWDDNQYLYIAATYLNNHDLNKAKLVIKNRFGEKGSRNKYKEVFEYFENLEE
ncbi:MULTISPECIES: hypothetical protein [Catenibacterium]|uniref:hypothetical protein n=1 Tax=Catenibacterium TaxID=135858 RepID=UPI001C2255C6|nr:hypothetical protein [Catenibacterium mitsuokai]MBU9057546.1 hypothetical protein [Catenibacterium mitsuokai]MCB5428264.1 hypothetical protein [Catenibacterium mitsuokai]